MSSLAVAERKLENLEQRHRHALDEKLQAIRRSVITCAKCKQGSQISSWIFIQNHYYVEPYSCTGGAYWIASETEVCHIICPKCGTRHYIYNDLQRDKIVQLVDDGKFFKNDIFDKVEDEHDPQTF